MAAQVYMEFEKPLMELEKKIEELGVLSESMDLSAEVAKLEKKADKMRAEILNNLSRWPTAQKTPANPTPPSGGWRTQSPATPARPPAA